MVNTTFLSISEVAQELSLTRNDVKKLIDDGRLVAYNFGEIRVDIKDLKKFIMRSKMNSYEFGSKFLFNVLELMVDDSLSLSDAKAKAGELNPDGLQAYEQHKGSLFSTNSVIDQSTSTNTPNSVIDHSTPSNSALNPAEKLQKLIDLKMVSNPGISYVEAFSQVQIENRELAIAYQKDITR
jgi:excisionase family DNA binding protein